MSRVILAFFVILLLSASVEKGGHLSKDLKEISGWVFVNDTTLIAHNDSGDEASIFVLNLDGSIRKTVAITNAQNIDFEDITKDDSGHVFVGDFGNNANARKNLVIYKLKIKDVLSKDEVEAKKIKFSYADQTSFPPNEANLNYDVEAMAYYKDSLFLFTKCRTVPFDGKCYVYAMPTKAGEYSVKRFHYFKVGKRDWYRDAITSADIYKDELYLTTYNRMIIYSLPDKKASFKTQVPMLPLSQKEALAVHPNGKVYICDERNKLLGVGNIYIVDLRKKTK